MPKKLPTPCRHHGCPALVEGGGYCDDHKQDRWANDRRDSANERGYTAAWRRVRAQVLREEPLCRRCKAKDILIPAIDVHHRDGNVKNIKRSNLEPLCRSCHNRETHGRG